MTMPNFLVIGAEKAGTTALYHYLAQHPQVYMSPVKEAHFFTFEGERGGGIGPGHRPAEHVTSVDAYRELFEAASDEKAIGEASTSYIYYPNVASKIRTYVPHVKLIAVLRDPADRAYSNFLHCRWLGREPLDDFASALRAEDERVQEGWGALWHYRRKGLYHEQLARYFSVFDAEQIKVFLYEDLRSNPVVVTQDIFAFLGVDASFVPDVSAKLNVSGVPKNRRLHAVVTTLNRSAVKRFLPSGIVRALREPVRRRILTKPPTLSPELRRELVAASREDVLRLQDAIGRDLSSWLE